MTPKQLLDKLQAEGKYEQYEGAKMLYDLYLAKQRRYYENNREHNREYQRNYQRQRRLKRKEEQKGIDK